MKSHKFTSGEGSFWIVIISGRIAIPIPAQSTETEGEREMLLCGYPGGEKLKSQQFTSGEWSYWDRAESGKNTNTDTDTEFRDRKRKRDAFVGRPEGEKLKTHNSPLGSGVTGIVPNPEKTRIPIQTPSSETEGRKKDAFVIAPEVKS